MKSTSSGDFAKQFRASSGEPTIGSWSSKYLNAASLVATGTNGLKYSLFFTCEFRYSLIPGENGGIKTLRRRRSAEFSC